MKLPGMLTNSRTLNLAKENVLKARALHAATSATVAALLPVEPAVSRRRRRLWRGQLGSKGNGDQT